MNEEQFNQLVELLTDIKDSIDNLISSDSLTQKKLDDLKSSIKSIRLSMND